MKFDLYSIRVGITIPEYNFKKKDAEFYQVYKHKIIGNILRNKYKDLDPELTAVSNNTLVVEFHMHNYPKYKILDSLFFFDITKSDILIEIQKIKGNINNEILYLK